ncbi:MAG: hypothetical protein ABIX10_02395 [Acidimicrobiales bacterium]
MWQRLTEEHDAQVGKSTVRRYVAQVNRRMDVPLVEVMVSQHHPLGEEAEVDSGTASVILAGIPVDVSMFVIRLSASGRGYARAYLNECQEVFLDGHVHAFEHYGGVHAGSRYDNLKAVKARDRIESDRFIALRSHYRFDSSSASRGSRAATRRRRGGGGRRFRPRHKFPVPNVDSMAELNDLLMAGAARDDRRSSISGASPWPSTSRSLPEQLGRSSTWDRGKEPLPARGVEARDGHPRVLADPQSPKQ